MKLHVKSILHSVPLLLQPHLAGEPPTGQRGEELPVWRDLAGDLQERGQSGQADLHRLIRPPPGPAQPDYCLINL